MTNQEAIEILREKIFPCVTGDWKEAVGVAISALQAQDVPNINVGDMISRQAAVDALHTWFRDGFDEDRWWNSTHVLAALEGLPSAQPENEERKEESAQNVPKEDLISRNAAIDILDAYQVMVENGEENPYAWARLRMSELPSAQPERKTGRWLIREGISDAQCSECKMYFRDVYDMDNSDAFCRHCGTKMEGLKVVEDE